MEDFINKKKVGIATCSNDLKVHFGCALSGKLVRKLNDELDEEYPLLYAACIYHLLLSSAIDLNYHCLVICNDEPYKMVEKYLYILMEDISSLESLRLISISKYREIIGDSFLRSKADNFADSYRRKALNPIKLKKGLKLNVINISYRQILKIVNQIIRKKGRK